MQYRPPGKGTWGKKKKMGFYIAYFIYFIDIKVLKGEVAMNDCKKKKIRSPPA